MATLIDHWWSGAYQLVTSDFILDEAERAWRKPYWKARLTDIQVERAITLLRHEAEVVPVTSSVQGVAAHAQDDFVLATALAAEATHLVTGDRELLTLTAFRGIHILSQQAMLALLDLELSRQGESRITLVPIPGRS